MTTTFKQPLRQGVVAVIPQHGRLLVIRRSQQVVAAGAYCFPGGGVEPGESEEQALRREIEEELGACVEPLRPIWRSTTAWNVSLAWWLAELHADCMLTPNQAEVESIHWLRPAEIRLLPELLSSNHAFFAALDAGEFSLEI